MQRRSLFKLAGSLGLMSIAGLKPMFGAEAAEIVEVPPQLIMQLDWMFNVQFAGLLLADYLQLYSQYGVAVEIRPSEKGVVVATAVAKTLGMIGCLEQNVLLNEQAKGLPLKAIATMFQTSPYALMALPESGIQSLADLRGKRVAVHSDGVKVLALVQGVSGWRTGEIEVVEIPAKGKGDRLISGEFDAVQCYAVDEPIAFAERIGAAPIVLALDQYGYDAYAQVLFTSAATLNRDRSAVEAFLKASFEGWRRALAAIPQTAKIIAEQYAAPGSKYTNVVYQTQSLERVKPYVLDHIDADHIGVIDGDRWQAMSDRMKQYGLISKVLRLEDSVDLSFRTF